MPKKGSGTASASTGSNDLVIVNIDPNIILADDNTRFNLKADRIESLAQSIKDQSGVIEPLEVEPVEGAGEFQYRLTAGYYRLAAIKHLNVTQGAGMTAPCIVHINPTPLDRLRRQLAENVERENMSPMDHAVAIKKLMDAGVPRVEIRAVFPQPGGRKGAKIQPASNSWLNMRLSMLTLPKGIQEKIHAGRIPVSTAWQLTKVDADKRQSVLDRIDAEYKKGQEREEKEEEKFLSEEKTNAEKAKKIADAKAQLDEAEKVQKETQAELKLKIDISTEAFAKSRQKHDTGKDKKAADTAFREADKIRATAEVAATDAQKKYENAMIAYSKLDAAKKEEKAQKPAGKAQKAPTPQDVQKASKAEGSSNAGYVPLNAAEMRRVVSELDIAGVPDSIRAIANPIKECFAGILTPDQLLKKLKSIMGE